MKLTRREGVLLCLVACLGLSVWWTLPRPAPRPKVVAETLLQAFANRDYNRMLSYQHAHEHRQAGMTREQWIAVLRWAREDLLKDVEFTSANPEGITDHERQAQLCRTLVQGERQCLFCAVTDQTPTGPRTSLSMFIMDALTAKAILNGWTSEASQQGEAQIVVVRLLRQHRDHLRKIGFAGFVGNQPDSTLVRVDRWIEIWEDGDPRTNPPPSENSGSNIALP